MSKVDIGFQSATALLLREAFEGIPAGQNYTWFVQGKEGLFDALASVTAQDASRKPSPECASIAAHAFHILFVLRSANTNQGRPEPEGNWESTWAKQGVTDSEWAELTERIRGEYDLYAAWFSQNETFEGDHAYIEALVLLPHIAFHLGAIRQILKVV